MHGAKIGRRELAVEALAAPKHVPAQKGNKNRKKKLYI